MCAAAGGSGEEACSQEEELRAEVANTVVGGELKVGTGGGAVFFIDVCGIWREVLACGEVTCHHASDDSSPCDQRRSKILYLSHPNL
jgi:hypothetical protein